MKNRQWINLRKVKDETDFGRTMHVGDKFLYGPRMIDQLETKKKGDEITYYQVIKISGAGKNVEYVPRYEILEEDF
jgi:hypothetical protein